jgi:hypothetical protein
MSILGIIALIAVVVLGIMVLRVKSDPMEKESVRQALADSEQAPPNPPAPSPVLDSESSPQPKRDEARAQRRVK